MARIAGIKYETTPTGKKKSVTFNLKIWGERLEDLLDSIEIERIKNDPKTEYVSWDDVKKKLDRKHKTKN